MRQQVSRTHSYLSGRKMQRGAFDMTGGKSNYQLTDAAVRSLAKIGLVFDHATVLEQINALSKAGAFRQGAMDAAFTAPITTPSIPTPLQFLQTWLPGFVKVMTAARKIDDIIGIKTVGSWEDQEIVQGMVEPAATAAEYGDFTNIPLASWNTNFERRTIVRGEMGIAVGLLEEGRAAAMRLNSAETKRQAAAVSLEIMRNAIGFFGWNVAGNRTFGFLNDPNLPAAISTSTAGGWSGATFQGITGDIRLMFQTLRTQSQDQVDPEKVDTTLVLPTNVVDYLSVVTDFGISVRDWLTQTYKRCRVMSAPELMGQPAGGTPPLSLAYLFADEIDAAIDGSSDGGETFAQLVQTKFMTLGVEKRAKSYVEDYANATAGVLCKRPWAVVRMAGI
jgi:hypothetical protein